MLPPFNLTNTKLQGWIYFFNPTLKTVTDLDIRKPEVYSSIMNDKHKACTLQDSMEIHFFAQGRSITAADQIPNNFYLFVDHSRCIAFYEDELELMCCRNTEYDPIRGASIDPLVHA